VSATPTATIFGVFTVPSVPRSPWACADYTVLTLRNGPESPPGGV
jgi:hypothetical protein